LEEQSATLKTEILTQMAIAAERDALVQKSGRSPVKACCTGFDDHSAIESQKSLQSDPIEESKSSLDANIAALEDAIKDAELEDAKLMEEKGLQGNDHPTLEQLREELKAA
jgi:hypothetical protein